MTLPYIVCVPTSCTSRVLPGNVRTACGTCDVEVWLNKRGTLAVDETRGVSYLTSTPNAVVPLCISCASRESELPQHLREMCTDMLQERGLW